MDGNRAPGCRLHGRGCVTMVGGDRLCPGDFRSVDPGQGGARRGDAPARRTLSRTTVSRATRVIPRPITARRSRDWGPARPTGAAFARSARPASGAPAHDGTFVHLHVHSEYSLVDSVVRIPELLAGGAGRGMPAVASDRSGQPVRDGHVLQGSAGGRHQADHRRRRLGAPGRTTAGRRRGWCCCVGMRTGYGNLARLVSRSYLEGQEDGLPVLHARWFERAAPAV